MMIDAKAHEPSHGQQTADDWEALSALLDDELDEHQAAALSRAVSQNPQARARWSEYCLIGDALRGELQVQPKLMAGLRQAIEQEPTVLAPMPRAARARPALWLAAAAAVGGITWTLWGATPQQDPPVAIATLQATPAVPAIPAEHLLPYLAAHQDYAQAVVSAPEMQLTRVSLGRVEGGR